MKRSKKEPPKDLQPCSAEFLKCIDAYAEDAQGYIQFTCNCGRQYDELDGLQVYSYSGTRWIESCPCNALRRYEDWLLHNRSIVLEFFKLRAQNLYDMGKRELKSLNMYPEFLPTENRSNRDMEI